MSKTTFKLNSAGVRQLMQSGEMQNVLKDEATIIKNSAGDGYEQDIYVGKTRANAMVYANTYQAKKENLKNNTLLKAVNK